MFFNFYIIRVLVQIGKGYKKFNSKVQTLNPVLESLYNFRKPL
jgi:hypothetical protein